MVANGYAKERTVMTGAGPVALKTPRVDDRREGERYRSAILPVYMRKSPKVTEVDFVARRRVEAVKRHQAL